MEFVAEFIEIIFMLALLFLIGYGCLYFLRHRTRVSRWINHYESKDNAAEKDSRIRELRRKQEDAQSEIDTLNEEANPGT